MSEDAAEVLVAAGDSTLVVVVAVDSTIKG